MNQEMPVRNVLFGFWGPLAVGGRALQPVLSDFIQIGSSACLIFGVCGVSRVSFFLIGE
jgi:hypothetical protein